MEFVIKAMGSTALIFSHLNKDGRRRLWELAPPTRSLTQERKCNQVSQERAATGIFSARPGVKRTELLPGAPSRETLGVPRRTGHGAYSAGPQSTSALLPCKFFF